MYKLPMELQTKLKRKGLQTVENIIKDVFGKQNVIVNGDELFIKVGNYKGDRFHYDDGLQMYGIKIKITSTCQNEAYLIQSANTVRKDGVLIDEISGNIDRMFG